jgi:leucyl aminopeptidase
LLVGQGVSTVTRRNWRKALQATVGALAKTRVESAAVALTRPATRDLDDYLFARSAAEITHAALYRVNDLKSAKKPPAPALKSLKFGPVGTSATAARRGLRHGDAAGRGARP